MGSPRVGSNPAVVVVVHLWPSGLRRYVQVVVIIRWRRFESCRVHSHHFTTWYSGWVVRLHLRIAGSNPVGVAHNRWGISSIGRVRR